MHSWVIPCAGQRIVGRVNTYLQIDTPDLRCSSEQHHCEYKYNKTLKTNQTPTPPVGKSSCKPKWYHIPNYGERKSEFVVFTEQSKVGAYDPPIIDIPQAAGAITSECARTSGRANPVTTTVAVMNRPRSTGPDPS